MKYEDLVTLAVDAVQSFNPVIHTPDSHSE